MNTNFLNSVANFIKKRTFELMGLILIFVGIALSISFATYSPSDPSLVYGEKKYVDKKFFWYLWKHYFRLFITKLWANFFLLLITFVSWGINLVVHKELKRLTLKIFLVTLYLIFGCTFFFLKFNNSFG